MDIWVHSMYLSYLFKSFLNCKSCMTCTSLIAFPKAWMSKGMPHVYPGTLVLCTLRIHSKLTSSYQVFQACFRVNLNIRLSF